MIRLRQGLVILAVVGSLLVGCAKSDPRDHDPVEPEVELTIGSMGAYEHVLQPVIRDFEQENPHIRIRTIEVAGYMSSSGEIDPSRLQGIDMIYGPGGRAFSLHQAGLLLDLSTMSIPAMDPVLETLWTEESQFAGRRMWFPIRLRPEAIRLREQDFRMNGIPFPDADWTYSEFETVLQALMDAGTPRPLLQVWALRPDVVYAFGGSDYDASSGRFRFNTPENLEAYTYLRRLLQTGLITAEHHQLPSPLSHGSSWLGSDPGHRYLPPPVGPAGRRVQVQSEGLMLLASSPHPEEATSFLRYLLTPKAQVAIAGERVRPLMENEAAKLIWRQTVGSEVAELIELSLAGGYVLDQSMYTGSGVEEVLWEGFLELFTGTGDIAETLAMLDERLNP